MKPVCIVCFGNGKVLREGDGALIWCPVCGEEHRRRSEEEQREKGRIPSSGALKR